MTVEYLLAPAKVTLSLRITGLRKDGFHLIDAEMVQVDLYDELEIDPAGDGLVVEDAGRAQPGQPDNLVSRALVLAGRQAGVRLRKRIPAGAGLGGGSADAAAILKWAGALDLDDAATLGADVPFCVVGGRARVTGIGEVIEALDVIPTTLTLLTPPLHCSTPVVYRTWDDMGGPTGDNGNDLEPAALLAYPQLVAWRDVLGNASGQRPRLAGSGSTWFVEGEYQVPGSRVVQTLAAD